MVLTDAVCRIHTVTPAEQQQSECGAVIIPLPATSLPYLLFFQRIIVVLFFLTATLDQAAAIGRLVQAAVQAAVQGP